MLKIYLIPVLFLLLYNSSNAQMARFDVFSFAEPSGFTKDTKPGVVTYSISNDTKGTYCMIVIGSSSISSGNQLKDFNAQWEKLARPFNPKTKPEVHKGDPVNGCKILTGVAQFDKGGTQGALLLSTYSGKVQCASIMYLLNDSSYQKILDDFSNQVTVNSNASCNSNDNELTTTTTSSDKINYTAPKGWTSIEGITNGAGFVSPLLECTDHSIYKLFTLPMVSYTGSLQDYAYQMHKAYFYQSYNQYLAYNESDKRMVKGIDDMGREFFSFETPAHSFADNTWHYGMVYLIRNGNTMASFIVELQPIDRNKSGPPSSAYNFIDDCSSLKTVWKKFISSIIFPNTAAALKTVPEELEGTWTSRVHLGWSTLAGRYAVENSQVVEKYTFNDNGTYSKDEFAKGKTNGTFSISGNKINFAEAKGKKYSYSFTLTSTFEYARWHKALSFFDANGQEIKLNYETVQ